MGQNNILRDQEQAASTDYEKWRTPELGVLLVHGIGHQKRGETLPWAGDPLFKWLRAWFGQPRNAESQPIEPAFQVPPYAVYMGDSRLVRPLASAEDAPPYARVWFQETSTPTHTDPNWVLAESFWADEFTPPKYSELLRLGFFYAPWLLEQTALRVRDRLFTSLRSLEPQQQDQSRLGASILYGLMRLSQFATDLLGVPLLLIAGPILQLFQLLLLVLALTPLRGFAVKVQVYLAGWLGDAYLVGLSPIRFEAMVSQVRRDIEWLASDQPKRKACNRIAVIAHSGGAIVAHAALTEGRSEQLRSRAKPPLLITYGSGHSKEDRIRLLTQRDSPGGQTVLRWLFSIGPTVVLGLLIWMLTSSTEPLLKWSITGAIILGLCVLLRWQTNRLRGEEGQLGLEPFRPRQPAEMEWHDYIALADIVPDDKIKAIVDNPSSPIEISELVNNKHSIFADHGAYWQNSEEFVADVAKRLYKLARGENLSRNETDEAALQQARIRRPLRVDHFLRTGLVSTISLYVLWFSLGQALEWIGEHVLKGLLLLIPDFLKEQLKVVLSIFQGNVPPLAFWHYLLGGAVVGLAVLAWQKFVISRRWDAWGRKEEQALFARNLPGQARDPQQPDNERYSGLRKSAWWYMAWTCVLPAATILVHFFWYHAPDNPLEFSTWFSSSKTTLTNVWGGVLFFVAFFTLMARIVRSRSNWRQLFPSACS